MVLGCHAPRDLVIGSHLFKYSWASLAKRVLRFDNINDVRNGLLLLK